MSNKVFTIWPALVIALLLAAVWYWGLPAEPAQAHDLSGESSPYIHFHAGSLVGDAVAAGDFLTVDVGGFPEPSSGERADRVWLYLWTADAPDASFPGCASPEVARDENLLAEGFLDQSRVLSFRGMVRVPPFQDGNNNFLCALRVNGESVSRRLQVDVLPDVYLMQLELNSIVAAGTDSADELLQNNALKDDFEVDGGRGLTEWGTASGFTQVRGVDGGTDGISGEEALLRVSGEWRACPRRGTLEVGCEWEDLAGDDAKLGGRYSGADVHLVPGDDMVLRVSLPTSGSGDLNLAAERFVVFWGPVDVWLLGTDQRSGGVEAADYVVHDDHLRPMTSELNSKIVQLSPGDSVDLPISRISANRQGHTFVSMVACNDSYLKRLVGSDALTGELAERLRGLEDCTVQQGPAFEDYGSNMPLGTGDDAYIRMREIVLADAWLQNDVLSGRELYCEIAPTIYRDWDEDRNRWRETWTMEIFCENPVEPWDDLRTVSNDIGSSYSSVAGPEGCYDALVRPYSWDSYSDQAQVEPVPPVDAVPPSNGNPGTPASPAVTGVKELTTGRYRCGWGPHHFQTAEWPIPLGYTNPWYTTRYNAADSFYSFAVEWKEGGFLGGADDGCSAMLLPYNVRRGNTLAARYPDTSHWRVGRVSSRACEVDKGVDSVDLRLRTPRPPASRARNYRQALAYERKWGRYPDHSMHFAVYLSGMPTAFDYRVGADPGGGESSGQWRLVSLGSWVYEEDGELRSGSYGGRSLLGVAHPVGLRSAAAGGESGRDGALDSVPTVSDFYDGLPVTVTRDFANDHGEVDVYVVPCRPLQSGAVPVTDDALGACEHLPAGRGHIRGVTFEQGDDETGPFGLVEPNAGGTGYTLGYSVKFTVRFLGSAWHDDVDRRVSLPVEESVPVGGECVVSSAVEYGSLYWPERSVSGGACDRDNLDVAQVTFRNDGRYGLSSADSSPTDGRLDRLVVYVTGGRSDRLDLIHVNQAGQSYDDGSPLGRLGVRERSLSLEYGSSGVFHVSPDLAGDSGEVWLLAYSCGADSRGSRNLGAWGHCPWVSSVNDFYDVPVPPSFVVRVKFTDESGLTHADLGPVCQGADCNPRTPVLRDALPDGSSDSCEVSSYPAGVSGMVYWPDRLVQGGACAPFGLSPVSVTITNASAIGNQALVVYATGGRTPGLETVQVRRGGGADSTGEPSGAVGLREVRMSLDSGEAGSVLVDPDLADQHGRVWLLAYRCSGRAGACPAATAGGDLTTYAVDRRPLFQVLVQFDAGLLSVSDIAICRGDSCAESYPLGRLASPSGDACEVSASFSSGHLYWPDRVVAGGSCDRNDLADVPVSFDLPVTAGDDEHLMVYVTGGRSPGLAEVSVLRAPEQQSGGSASRAEIGYYADPLYDLPVVVEFPDDGVPSAAANVRDAGRLLEEHNTQNMRWIRHYDPDLYDALSQKAWAQDGLTDLEKRTLDYLLYLAAEEELTVNAAKRVAGMPFLTALDEADYLTVRALNFAIGGATRQNVINPILDHVALRDGIRDADRVLVIGASTMRDRAAVDGLLGQGYAHISTTEHSGLKVTMARRNTSPNESYVVDQVVASASAMERWMGQGTFPVTHVVVLADTDSVIPGAAGVNYGYAMSYLPSREEPAGTRAAQSLRSTIVHEVAHYYWRGGERWVNEGMASAFEVILGPGFLIPDAVTRNERRDCDLPNLRALVEAAPSGPLVPAFYCNYYLGQRLFLDLRETLGDGEFRAGAQRLYRSIRDCRAAQRDRCGTVDDVHAAFPSGRSIIDLHWGETTTVIAVTGENQNMGRLGLREVNLTVPVGGSGTVMVSPDLAGKNGDVWLLAYRCETVHGDAGCPKMARPALNGYDLPVGPDLAVRVNFTESSGLTAAELQGVCRGQACDIEHPWLRQAEPGANGCQVDLPAHWDFWPDRVIRGGGCYFRGAAYGPVDFRSEGNEKIVVYVTGGVETGLDLVPVHGVFGQGGDAAQSKPLGKKGLRETRLEPDGAREGEIWVRSNMGDDGGNVWLLAYRCRQEFGDAGCPLVGRDAIRPSYDVPIRPAFVVRAQFVDSADADRSTLMVDCSDGSGTCRLTAIFRNADGETLPGTVEFRVDNGALGPAGSTARVSRQPHQSNGSAGHRFEETLILPPPGNVVNIEAELLGDGLVLRQQAGLAGALERLSVRVMRCSGDEASCHSDDLEAVDGLLAGQWFVLWVTGYDVAGNVVVQATSMTAEGCQAGPSVPWPEFRLNSRHLRSHGYETTQPDDRGYAGCAVRVSEDAPLGTYGISVSYGTLTVPMRVAVIEDPTKLGFIGLTGPFRLESGKSGDYTAQGYTMAGLPSSFEDGCLKLKLTGPLEAEGGGSSGNGCLAEALPGDGQEFTVRASEDVIYDTDASVGVTFDGHRKVMHVLVVPARETAALPPVVPSSSHITNLTITPEGSQLRVSWTGSPTADFESLRAQVWVVIGGEDVFLLGCMGGEALDVSTQEVFCMLSYGQSGDVYHAAVGFLRRDGSAVPVETAQWVRH